jgi:2,3-bisphosphoglycerate-independent phosphoglycerate mutase
MGEGHARPRPLVLIVVDGFGLGPDPAADAIASAAMPSWRALLEIWPSCRLEASGPAVGLPEGQMGNSEVGHLNLGAGRPVLQDLPRIDAAIADGSLFANPVLLEAARFASSSGCLHLVSLVGPGGVHANDRQLVAVAELARREGVPDVAVHALLDGRDTPPQSAGPFLESLEERLRVAHPNARIATVAGRYYGMDRDLRWERIDAFYAAMAHADGLTAPTAARALADAYERGESDEFVRPTVIDGYQGVRDGDVAVHCNFRADRARQLIHALVDGDTFAGFDRGSRPRLREVVTMTSYEEGLPVHVAFPPLVVTSSAEILSGLGWRQLHVAETEKYAHVTYFFNGGVEDPWPGEDRILIPSPKVATYDLQPEMSAGGITDAILDAVAGGSYDFIVANYANPDMVGHTGVWDATVAACTFLDGCLGRVADAVLAIPGALLAITADHGNADVMRDTHGAPVTAHSMSPVPLLLAGDGVGGRRLRDGVLADVAPTLLSLVGVQPAPGMTGRSLVADEASTRDRVLSFGARSNQSGDPDTP